MSRQSSKFSVSRSKSPIASRPSTTSIAPSITQTHVNHMERPGFFSNVFQGFALGAGQSIAMNMFRSNPVVTHVHETEYTLCMKDKKDHEACKHLEKIETSVGRKD